MEDLLLIFCNFLHTTDVIRRRKNSVAFITLLGDVPTLTNQVKRAQVQVNTALHEMELYEVEFSEGDGAMAVMKKRLLEARETERRSHKKARQRRMRNTHSSRWQHSRFGPPMTSSQGVTTAPPNALQNANLHCQRVPTHSWCMLALCHP